MLNTDFLIISSQQALTFLCCLSRVLSMLLLIPLPGVRTATPGSKIAIAILIAMLLTPLREPPPATLNSALAQVFLPEPLVGLACGISIAVVTEGVNMAVQLISVHAGFGYLSTIDPTTEADSSTLQILFNLACALILITIHLDEYVISLLLFKTRISAVDDSSFSRGALEVITPLTAAIFTDAIRLALPVIAVLLCIDLCLALISRTHAQMQLLSLSFPVKILLTFIVLALQTPVLVSEMERASQRSLESISGITSPAPRHTTK